MPTVREKPPLRVHVDAITPSGRHQRWGQDERRPENVLRDLQWGSSMPGGYDTLEGTLPRKPGVDYADLTRLSTLRVVGAGGRQVGEYRLESAPRVSGAEMSVSPSAVGWRAALEDDKTAREIYVDRELSAWQDPTRTRREILTLNSIKQHEWAVDEDQSSTIPAIRQTLVGLWSISSRTETLYYGGGIALGSIYVAGQRGTNISTATDWSAFAYLADSDALSSSDASSDQHPGPTPSTLNATTATRKWAALQLHFATFPAGTEDLLYDWFWTCIAVYGTHALTKRGTASATAAQGLYASDVIANAISRWTPLTYTTGADGTVKPTAFVIPQLAFKEPTTALAILEEANRYHLNDWAVWNDRTFYYAERGVFARKWRARVGPSELAETGPSVERLWNGVLVRYNDVDGTQKLVGPTGSVADSTSADLTDTDPDNPVNQAGLRRWTLLDMGIVSTAAAATEVGRRFLVETKQLDRSGSAKVVGYIEDDRGVVHPYHHVRAGDTISFVDAADTSERRIVKAQNDLASRTCSIDLDAPPEGMDELLARLGVVLVPLGL